MRPGASRQRQRIVAHVYRWPRRGALRSASGCRTSSSKKSGPSRRPLMSGGSTSSARPLFAGLRQAAYEYAKQRASEYDAHRFNEDAERSYWWGRNAGDRATHHFVIELAPSTAPAKDAIKRVVVRSGRLGGALLSAPIARRSESDGGRDSPITMPSWLAVGEAWEPSRGRESWVRRGSARNNEGSAFEPIAAMLRQPLAALVLEVRIRGAPCSRTPNRGSPSCRRFRPFRPCEIGRPLGGRCRPFVHMSAPNVESCRGTKF